jgi:hypothetical protein
MTDVKLLILLKLVADYPTCVIEFHRFPLSLAELIPLRRQKVIEVSGG